MYFVQRTTQAVIRTDEGGYSDITILPGRRAPTTVRAPRQDLSSPGRVGLLPPERPTWQSATTVRESDVLYWLEGVINAQGPDRENAASQLCNSAVGLSFDPIQDGLYVILTFRTSDETDRYAYTLVGYLKSVIVKDSHFLAMTVAQKGGGDDGVLISVPFNLFQ
jgi:hypothetical protein